MLMFTFKLNNSKKQDFNYPKYIIVLKNLNSHYFHGKTFFYYLISTIKSYTGIYCKFPTYMIIPNLYFDKYNKVDLSKLGTNYLFNYICAHYQNECIGSYPDNYVFVKEPDWPYEEIDITDRTPLKRSYKYLWKN